MLLALEAAGWSIQSIADHLGVTGEAVWGWLLGQREPSRSTVVLWATRCGVPVEWLETGAASLAQEEVAEVVARGAEIATAVALSEVGRVNAMAEGEQIPFVAELQADPVMLRVVLRRLASALVLLAGTAVVAVEEDEGLDEDEEHDRTVFIIRRVFEEMITEVTTGEG